MNLFNKYSALLIQPLIGQYKKGEYSDKLIIKTNRLASEKFNSNKVFTIPFFSYPRYAGFRETAITNAWNEIASNQYMNYLPVELTKTNEIDAQTYKTAEEYFTGYLAAASLGEEDFTPTERQAVIDAIQATINNPVLTISIPTLDAQVTASIITDATTYATTEQASDTFTLS